MKIIAHGVDLVDFGRIEQMLSRHEQRFLERVFTATELADAGKVKNRIEKLAGRFASKEAVMKLIGTGWRDGIAWTDIEITNNAFGQPQVSLRGRVRQIADEKQIEQITLSITHTSNFAIASAVALQTSE
ncbi:MAG: holo-ACP synthase [Planctomycetaceae bacterium]|nr:holo-ACP synthase [Planctomycetaceae bacterium]